MTTDIYTFDDLTAVLHDLGVRFSEECSQGWDEDDNEVGTDLFWLHDLQDLKQKMDGRSAYRSIEIDGIYLYFDWDKRFICSTNHSGNFSRGEWTIYNKEDSVA